MENQKLVNEKLENINAQLKELSEIKGGKVSFVFMATAPAPDKGEDTVMSISALFGNNLNVLQAIRKSMEGNEDLSNALKVAAKMSPIEDMLLGVAIDAKEKGVDLEADDEGDIKQEQCDCPSCRAERGENPLFNSEPLERKPYERAEDFEARRKEAIKNNPNIN